MTSAPSKQPRWRLAYLVTHPIQYQAPLLRLIAADPEIDLEVFFQSALSLGQFRDPGFGREIAWDLPLAEGYRHRFLPSLGDHRRLGPLRPFSYGFGRVLEERRFDALWVHGYARAFHLWAMLQAKRRGLKVLLRDETWAEARARGSLRRITKQFAFGKICKIVDCALAIGSRNDAYLGELGFPPERRVLMPYAVDNEAFATAAADLDKSELRRHYAVPPGRPVILFAAKLIARKRPQDLLAAARRFSNLPETQRPLFLFVGDGEMRADLELAAQNMEGVRFLGFRGQREMPLLYGLADIFVLPSAREAWGLAVNEAMACGTSILASSRVGAAVDLVKPGINGEVFPACDPKGLAEALQRLLADPDRLNQMGEASRRIIANWSFAEDVAGLKRALSEVCSSPDPRANLSQDA